MEQIQNIIDRVIKEFETKPIATTIKGLIILWVLKEVKKWWNN